jgi:hypothetical protein
MQTPGRRFRTWSRVLTLLCLSACAPKVPPEVVELSYTVGQDLGALQASYRTLIDDHFDNLRSQRIRFLETEWRPVFLERYIAKTNLQQIITSSTAADLPDILSLWTAIALDTIKARSDSLTASLDRDQAALTQLVDQSFGNLMWANATITSHLNSVRKVQEVQDRALSALNLKDLRDRIDAGFVTASLTADSVLAAFRKAQGLLEKASRLDH